MSLSFIRGDFASLAHSLGSESEDGAKGAEGVSVKTGFAHWLFPLCSLLSSCFLSDRIWGEIHPGSHSLRDKWDLNTGRVGQCLSEQCPSLGWGLWECGSLLSPGPD